MSPIIEACALSKRSEKGRVPKLITFALSFNCQSDCDCLLASWYVSGTEAVITQLII